MSQELAGLIAKRFIQRRDVKAVQFPDGKWSPDTRINVAFDRYAPLGFKMNHLQDHLDGNKTYGHYLLDRDDLCRVFVFDIDLIEKKINEQTGEILKAGTWVQAPEINGTEITSETEGLETLIVHDNVCPRSLWRDRTATSARSWYKYQMRTIAQKFANVIVSELNIGCAVAYSGNKGIHVYGLCGQMPGAEAREGAALVMDILGDFQATRGNNFFKHLNDDPIQGFQNFEIEVFPKQDSLEGKDLGNLVRLPLGRNLKSPDPCFLLDLKTPLWQLVPHPDPVSLLSSGNPYL